MGQPVPAEPEIARILDSLQPSADFLFDLLRLRVDDTMLQEIAEADSGFDVRENLEALHCIRDLGEIPYLGDFIPTEVLGLTRWSEPDVPGLGAGDSGLRGHIMRAFSAAVLLLAGGDPVNADLLGGGNQSLAQLMGSVLALGGDLPEAALGFVCWRLQAPCPLEEHRPFFAFAVLLLCVRLGKFRDDQKRLLELADWVVREEAQAHEDRDREEALHCLVQQELGFPEAGGPSAPERSAGWLLGVTLFDLRHNVWRALARDILVEAELPYGQDVAGRLREIGRLVLEGA